MLRRAGRRRYRKSVQHVLRDKKLKIALLAYSNDDSMKILDLFGKKDSSQELGRALPYKVTTEFVPYHLYSNSSSSVMLLVRVKNLTKEQVLSSVVIEVPKTLSLDNMGLVTAKELRLGTIAPDEEKESRVDIHGGAGTEKGEYTLSITAFIHYRDYGHVLNAMKKRAVLEVE